MIPNPYRGLRGLPADVWIIAATTLVNRAGMMALPFLVLYATRELHVSAAVAGVTLSVYGMGGLVAAPFAGRLSDRIGPFAVMRGSLALTGVVLLIIPFVRHFYGLVGLTFLWAFVADAGRPATMAALTGSASPEQRKPAIAVNRLAVNLGMSVGPAVGGFLATISFPILFAVDGVTSLAAAAVLSALLWIEARRGHKTGEFAKPGDGKRQDPFGRNAMVWRDRRALLFFGAMFLMNIVFSQHVGALSLFLVRDLGYSPSFYGKLFMLNTLLIVVAEVPLNLAMTHWKAWKANALAVLLIALGFGSLAFVRSPLAITASVVAWTVGEMILFPTSTAYMAELAPEGRIGEYMGGFSATMSLAVIFGPWAGTTLLDRFGGPAVWTIMLVCGLASAALLVLTRKAVTRP